MSPPNFVSQRVGNKPTSNNTSNTSRFSLCNRNISVDGITLLSEVPVNVALSPFSSLPHSSDTDSIPLHILKSVASKSKNGAFLGLSVKQAQDRILNPIGQLLNRKFLSLFRFKIWWSTMWVGSSGSDLQMETQLILLQLPELNSFAVLIPLIEAIFALQFTLVPLTVTLYSVLRVAQQK